MQLKDIARVCYALNREVAAVNGEEALPAWEDAPQQIKDGYIKGVEFRIKNPMATASAQHDEWMKARRVEGWVFGPEKCTETKEHPNLVPYIMLPVSQRLKDTLFKNTVVALSPLYFAALPEEKRLAS